MPINASHEYFEAEKKYLAAQTIEEKIERLKELIKAAPKHKGSENLLAELRTRLKKFLEKQDKLKKSGKGKKGIRKERFQVVLVGKTNSGKSMLINKLTNASSKVSENLYSTKEPIVGMMEYEGVRVQMIDMPSVNSEGFDNGIANNADCLLIVINNLDGLEDVNKKLQKAGGKKLVVINKIDELDLEEKRKLNARCMSRKIECVFISAKTMEGISELKKKIFESMEVIRVYTKEPGKEKNSDPVVLSEGSTVRDVAETIYKGFSLKIKEARLTGPSGKFQNQRVGLNHKLKDRDVLEFK